MSKIKYSFNSLFVFKKISCKRSEIRVRIKKRKIRVPNRFVLFVRFVFKKISCKKSVIREIRVRIKEEIRVCLERQRKIRVQE